MDRSSSSEPKRSPPSFFKVVRFPSASQLALPHAFVRMHLGKIPKNPILKTETGKHSWRLTFKKIGNDYCFANGWDELVKDAQLCIRDFVVFTLADPFTFQVSFYNSDGCEKVLPSNNTSDDDDVAPTPDLDLSFQKCISLKSHKYSLVMPQKFVKNAGLENRTSIKLKDHEGKEWVLGLLTETYTSNKLSLSAGWSFFREYHDLFDGDICFFKFLKEEGMLILTQVLKNKNPRNQGTFWVVDGGNIQREWSAVSKSPPPPPPPPPAADIKIKIETEEAPTVEGGNRQREQPPVLKFPPPAAADIKIKIETEDTPCPPLVKPCGFVKVKKEEEMGVERKRERPMHVADPSGSSGFPKVKTDVKMDLAKRKRGRPRVNNEGVEVEMEMEMEMEMDGWFGNKQVVYF